MPRTLFVAPAGRSVGLTTAALGLVRALDRQGVRVAFCKPISTRSADRSIALVKLGSTLHPPDPIARQRVEDLLSNGDEQTLLEEVALSHAYSWGSDPLADTGTVEKFVAAVADLASYDGAATSAA